jgi:hypothetical protein
MAALDRARSAPSNALLEGVETTVFGCVGPGFRRWPPRPPAVTSDDDDDDDDDEIRPSTTQRREQI